MELEKKFQYLNLAELIKEVINYKGSFLFDKSKPDGVLRKVSDLSKINSLGWKSKTSLRRELNTYTNHIYHDFFFFIICIIMKGYSKYFWLIHFIGDILLLNFSFFLTYYIKFDSFVFLINIDF